MQSISNAHIKSCLDLDHGEGWVTFSWRDHYEIARSLEITFDGHCSREMPIRSGTGVTITSIGPDQVRLQFTAELARILELEEEVEFNANMPEMVYSDLLRFAEIH